MKKFLIAVSIVALSGCSTIQQYWPKKHDPVMFNQLVEIDIAIEKQTCESPTWHLVIPKAEQLARYAEWRQDPQATNLKGLHQHVVRMDKGGSKTFCEIGRKTAQQRIHATRSAWEGR
jgi:uncharacterized protein YceK